jgi:hypothetical protein
MLLIVTTSPFLHIAPCHKCSALRSGTPRVRRLLTHLSAAFFSRAIQTLLILSFSFSLYFSLSLTRKFSHTSRQYTT